MLQTQPSNLTPPLLAESSLRSFNVATHSWTDCPTVEIIEALCDTALESYTWIGMSGNKVRQSFFYIDKNV